MKTVAAPTPGQVEILNSPTPKPPRSTTPWKRPLGGTSPELSLPTEVRFEQIRHPQRPSLIILLALTAFSVVRGNESIIDYHLVRGREAAPQAAGLYEGEDLPRSGTAREQGMGHFGPHWSGDAHLLWHGKVGDAFEARLSVPQSGRYRLTAQLTKAPDYGKFTISSEQFASEIETDLYAAKVRIAEPLLLTESSLPAGELVIKFRLRGHHDKAKPFRDAFYLLGIDCINLRSLDPAPVAKPSNPNKTTNPSQHAERLDWPTVQKTFSAHCYQCHGFEKLEGKLNLAERDSQESFLEDVEKARTIADAIRFGEMPPEDSKPLDAETRQSMADTIDTWIEETLQNERQLPVSIMRRMNRFEYNNSVRDLLGLKGDIFALPEKPIRAARPYFDPASGHYPASVRVSNRALGKNQIEQHLLTGVTPFAIDLQAEHGFSNQGELLSVSPILLESFLKLGQGIVFSPEFDDYCQPYDALFTLPKTVSISETNAVTRHARQILAPLMERAFRDNIEPATLERYVRHFQKEFERTSSYTHAMKHVVAGLLASPQFVYFSERKASDHEAPLTPYEVATRLSYFLWSSLPDDVLLARAHSGELLEPAILQAEISRLLESPRSQALSQSFARQWLRLDQLITAVPDFERFEAYYSRIGCEQWKFGLQTMLEPLLLFESIMVEDRSIMLLVDSNYAYRSDEMQSWYQDAEPFNGKANRNRFNTFVQTFRRQTLDTRREGSVLTTAATLTMTSSPLRTNPITRGSWVATVILNRPPPPPPDIVPEIEEDDAAIEARGLTLRDRLKQHQVNPNCVSCHQKIDPLGYALENYDAVGRWRETYRSGLPIDASGTLFGESSFNDIIGLKDALLKNPEWFMRAFCEHLLSYALGRELKVDDRPAVDRILRQVIADKGRFSTVVRQVATSYPFLHKTHQTSENSVLPIEEQTSEP